MACHASPFDRKARLGRTGSGWGQGCLPETDCFLVRVKVGQSQEEAVCAHPRFARAATIVGSGHVEAGGRGRGGSIGELRACDSGGAGSGCETAGALATAGDAEDDATSQLP